VLLPDVGGMMSGYDGIFAGGKPILGGGVSFTLSACGVFWPGSSERFCFPGCELYVAPH